MICEKFNIL